MILTWAATNWADLLVVYVIGYCITFIYERYVDHRPPPPREAFALLFWPFSVPALVLYRLMGGR